MALILIPQKDCDNIFFDWQGIEYALDKLKDCKALKLTDDNRKWVDRLLERLSISEKLSTLSPTQLQALLNIAIRWKDSVLWNKVVCVSLCNLGAIGGVGGLVDAWLTFGFEDVRVRFAPFPSCLRWRKLNHFLSELP